VLYFGPNSTCVSECGDRYYKNYTLNACELCSSSCSNCLNFSICTSCPSSYYLLTSACYLTCPLGYYPHSTQCLLCTSSLNCYTCANELTCASCSGSYYYYELKCLIACPSNTTTQNATTHTCDYCPSNCSTCYLSATDAVVCTACISGYLDAGRCLQLCETIGTVPSGSVCSSCDVSCLTCKGDTTFCLTCNTSSTFKYFMGNKCYADCPATYYNDNNTFSCLPCTMPCETCSGYSSNACTSCISNYSLLGTVCGSSCPQQYYSNSISCLTCVEPCLTCASALFCFTCVVNYSLVTSNYTCITACPEGYVSISQVCQPCSSNCLTCTTQTVCSTCPSSIYLFNGTCINPCVAGYFPNSTLGQC
jgi:proprotein convertase subtilisin/kexin type 5